MSPQHLSIELERGKEPCGATTWVPVHDPPRHVGRCASGRHRFTLLRNESSRSCRTRWQLRGLATKSRCSLPNHKCTVWSPTDEPTSGLDAASASGIMVLLRRLASSSPASRPVASSPALTRGVHNMVALDSRDQPQESACRRTLERQSGWKQDSGLQG